MTDRIDVDEAEGLARIRRLHSLADDLNRVQRTSGWSAIEADCSRLGKTATTARLADLTALYLGRADQTSAAYSRYSEDLADRIKQMMSIMSSVSMSTIDLAARLKAELEAL